MVLEVIEQYFWGGVVGFALGVVVARFYFRSRIEIKNIGHMIEYSMIRENITNLNSMSERLGEIVADMRECSEDIAEKLELTRDIEESFSRKEEGS